MKNYHFKIAGSFLCVAALLETIIKTDLNVDISQNEIGNYFGVYVPSDYSGELTNVIRTDDKSKWGIVITHNEVNNFFNHYNLPFKEQYTPISVLEDWSFEDKIDKSLYNNVNIICGVDYHYLFNNYQASSIGHVVLVIDKVKDSFRIYDPGPEGAGIKTVKSIDLFYGIHKKKNGIWEILKI